MLVKIIRSAVSNDRCAYINRQNIKTSNAFKRIKKVNLARNKMEFTL